MNKGYTLLNDNDEYTHDKIESTKRGEIYLIESKFNESLAIIVSNFPGYYECQWIMSIGDVCTFKDMEQYKVERKYITQYVNYIQCKKLQTVNLVKKENINIESEKRNKISESFVNSLYNPVSYKYDIISYTYNEKLYYYIIIGINKTNEGEVYYTVIPIGREMKCFGLYDIELSSKDTGLEEKYFADMTGLTYINNYSRISHIGKINNINIQKRIILVIRQIMGIVIDKEKIEEISKIYGLDNAVLVAKNVLGNRSNYDVTIVEKEKEYIIQSGSIISNYENSFCMSWINYSKKMLVKDGFIKRTNTELKNGYLVLKQFNFSYLKKYGLKQSNKDELAKFIASSTSSSRVEFYKVTRKN